MTNELKKTIFEDTEERVQDLETLTEHYVYPIISFIFEDKISTKFICNQIFFSYLPAHRYHAKPKKTDWILCS